MSTKNKILECPQCGYQITGELRRQARSDDWPCPRCGLKLYMFEKVRTARLPTTFETMVLTRIRNRRMLAGDGMVAISAACRRLERMGYASKPGVSWYVTEKGEKYLAGIE